MKVRFDEHGLVPAVVQDVRTGQVLMVAYMNQAALAATLDSGQVHFWSRSREELWRKGETTGNTLGLVSIVADCDGDTLLVKASPSGPACHNGTTTCFGDETLQGFSGLEDLWATISQRAEERPEGSYTVQLLAGGVDSTGRKVVEEAAEVLMVAKDHSAGNASDERLAEEAADLVYHLLVLLAERGLEPGSLLDVLTNRAR